MESIGYQMSELMNNDEINELRQLLFDSEKWLKNCSENDSIELQEAVEYRNEIYSIFNATLSNIAVLMGYIGQPDEWNDSKPLNEMLNFIPDIQNSVWYNLQLNQIMGL